MGRVQKKTKVILISVGAFILMVATVPLAIWVTHTSTAKTGNEIARCSSVMQPVHQVVIKDGKVSPGSTSALECDTLVITNEDSRIRLMAFGPHEHHISYDGVSERALGQGQSLTVKLVRAGTFTFHDHSDETVRGSFTVSK